MIDMRQFNAILINNIEYSKSHERLTRVDTNT